MTKDWKDIHEDFDKENYYSSYPHKTYQQSWEEQGLTYQDTQEWIAIGFKLDDYKEVKRWKEKNLTPPETKLWIESGLKNDQHNLVFHLKQNNFTPEQYANFPKNNAQEWFNYFFPKQVEVIDLKHLEFEQPSELIINNCLNLKEIDGFRVSNLTKLTISNCPQLEKIITSSFKNNRQLILNNLPNLKELGCRENNLTNLNLITCPNLQKIDCWNNLLTDIKLSTDRKKLEWLSLRNNNFHQDLSFLENLVNLKCLWLGSNKFRGSLEPLQKMSKLEELDINE